MFLKNFWSIGWDTSHTQMKGQNILSIPGLPVDFLRLSQLSEQWSWGKSDISSCNLHNAHDNSREINQPFKLKMISNVKYKYYISFSRLNIWGISFLFVFLYFICVLTFVQSTKNVSRCYECRGGCSSYLPFIWLWVELHLESLVEDKNRCWPCFQWNCVVVLDDNVE